MWEPWIGDRFAETGLLFLGERAYSWTEGEERKDPSARHSCDMVEWVTHDFRGCLGGQRFTVKLSRALTGERWPDADQVAQAWRRVAVTNYVPVTVGVGAGKRPSPALWTAAADEFPALLERIRPRAIIVLGIEMWWKRMPAPFAASTDEREYRLDDGSPVRCRGLRHPSRGFPLADLEAEIRRFGG